MANGPINVMPDWFHSDPAMRTLREGECFPELDQAAAIVVPKSARHRYCAVNLRQMRPPDWLTLLRDERLRQLTLPVLCLADERSLHDWNADPTAKQHQFYVQLGERYELAQLTSYHTLGHELPAIFGHEPEPGQMIENAEALLDALQRTYRTVVRAVSLTFDREGDSLVTFLSDLFGLPDGHSLAWLGAPLPGPDEPVHDDLLRACLFNLAGCYHIGRYRRAEGHATQRLQWPSTQTTSQKMFVGFRRAWREWAGRWESTMASGAQEPAAVYARMRLYFLFRDLARSLVSGGVDLPGRGRKPSRPVRFVLIDDSAREVVPHLNCLREELWKGKVAVVQAPVQAWSEFSTWFQRSWLDPTLTRVFPESDRKTTSPVEDSAQASFDDVFLVDVDFEGRDRGPELVTWIRSWRETPPQSPQLQPFVPKGKERRGWDPRIMILTNARASESIQLSMNLGVETYLFKDRIYSLPAWLSQIPQFEELKSVRNSSADFRSIHKMPIRMLARLNSREPGECITGDPNRVWERQWIERLPKADLHFHIGTSISTETTVTLATNTLWYALEVFGDETVGRLLRDVWDTLAAASQRMQGANRPAGWYDAIAEVIRERHPIKKDDDSGRSGYERMLAWWGKKYPLLGSHDIVAAVVVAVGHLEALETGVDVTAIPIGRLKQLCDEGGLQEDSRVKEGARRLWHRILDATRDKRWQGTFTAAAFRETRNVIEKGSLKDDTRVDLDKLLADRCATVRTFVGTVHDEWADARGRTSGDSRGGDASGEAIHAISLAQLVEVSSARGEGSLAKYLEGAALLGAEHLQYPENIVLAALDIVDQNVRDNVLYSEIRCAPTGYCIAGLEPLAATDILCESFDAAEVLYGTLYGRWIMTNVLLGAKRHKGLRDVRSVVELLTRYLQYPYGLSATGEVPGRPRWWRRTRVIGFDLSGREDIDSDTFHDALEPLFEYCAAITVHAGEAASAEKIWEAVYKLGARRIGHGLKLRNHERLLQYCLTEGICLELCPISNRYTNGFDEARSAQEDTQSPFQYPLGYYLKEGLRVAISTDNRYLHTEHRLTDDFLAGARMADGLSRLDVLRIVKNGFYNAFLNKADLGALLDAVDGMIFRSLAEEDERIYGPETA